MPKPDAGDFRARLERLVGRPPGGSGTSTAPDPVNQPMIRHWAAAFEDANPVYTDPDAAARSRFGGIVAPPMMLQTWTMATPVITGMAERGGAPTETGGESVMTVFEEGGFSGTLAVGSELEIERHLRLGEVVSAQTVTESISDEKQTRLGRGHFVTWLTTYTDESGAVVGRQRFMILKFAPQGVAE
jgi:acyl dehydratase